jgi:hypothetical protein
MRWTSSRNRSPTSPAIARAPRVGSQTGFATQAHRLEKIVPVSETFRLQEMDKVKENEKRFFR